jgi:hypothetical protein
MHTGQVASKSSCSPSSTLQANRRSMHTPSPVNKQPLEKTRAAPAPTLHAHRCTHTGQVTSGKRPLASPLQHLRQPCSKHMTYKHKQQMQAYSLQRAAYCCCFCCCRAVGCAKSKSLLPCMKSRSPDSQARQQDPSSSSIREGCGHCSMHRG